MPERLRLYLDTSVVSAYFDTRDPSRQRATQDFWRTLGAADPTISDLVLLELQATSDAARRDQMLGLVAALPVLPASAEAEALAAAYVAAGAFSPVFSADAGHVARAVAGAVPVLVSWNFRHLVNRTRRMKVNRVNAERGYNQIEIVSPPELE